MEERMEDFDWVTARAQCSPVDVFQKLKVQVTEDVEIRNRQLPDPRDAFKVNDEGNVFSVSLPTQPLRPRVIFSVANEEISVRDQKGNQICKAIELEG